jgi:hypothetical protein
MSTPVVPDPVPTSIVAAVLAILLKSEPEFVPLAMV